MTLNLSFRALGPDNDLDIIKLIALLKRNGGANSDCASLRADYWKRHIGHSFISLVCEIGEDIVAHSALRLSQRGGKRAAMLMHRYADASIQDFEDEAARLFAAAIRRSALANGAQIILTSSGEESLSGSEPNSSELLFHKACEIVDQRAPGQTMTIEAAQIAAPEPRRIYPSLGTGKSIYDFYSRLGCESRHGAPTASAGASRFSACGNSFFAVAKSGLGSADADDWLRSEAPKNKSVLLNLEDPGCASLAAKAESRGAVFSGTLPSLLGFDCVVYSFGGRYEAKDAGNPNEAPLGQR